MGLGLASSNPNPNVLELTCAAVLAVVLLLHREQRLVALVEARGECDHDIALVLQ